MRFSEASINRLPHPASGQRIVRDPELPGFGIRVTPNCKSWVVEFVLKGQRKRVTLGRCDLLNLAEARQRALLLMRSEPDNTGVTLQEVLDRFLLSRPLKAGTRVKYRKLIERHLEDWLAMPLRSITKDMVEQRHRALVGPTRCGTEGKGRANAVMEILRVLWYYAADCYPIAVALVNPVDRLKQNRQWFRLPPRQGVIPDHRLPDFYRAVMALESKVARDFYLLLLLTGLRRGEASRLRWQDIDLEGAVLAVPAEGTKNGREHRLPLTPFLLELLRSRLPYAAGGFVFPGRFGGHLNEPRAAKEALRKALGMNLLFHDLRRTFLTMAERLGVPHYTLRRMANHAVGGGDVTGRYVVVQTEQLREPMILVTTRLLELMGTSEQQWQEQDAGEPVLTSVVVLEEEEEEVYW